MATLTAKLTLSSSDIDPNNTLDLSLSSALTTADPSSMPSRVSVAHDAYTVLVAKDLSLQYYVYIKNIGSLNSRAIDVAEDKDNNKIATLQVGEFMFLPIQSAAGIMVQSTTSAEIVEYAYFAKG